MRVPKEPKAHASSESLVILSLPLYDGSPYVDFNDPRLRNSNITVLGQAGSGKMYHGEKKK